MKIHFNLYHHVGFNTRVNNIAYLRTAFKLNDIDVELDYKVINVEIPYGNYSFNDKYIYTRHITMGKSVIHMTDLEAYIKMINNFYRGNHLLNDIDVPKRMFKTLRDTESFYNRQLEYDYICFSCFDNHMFFHLYACLLAKKNNPNIKMVFGGPQIILSQQTRELLRITEIADYAISGDVESVLVALVKDELDPDTDIVKSYPMDKLGIPDYSYQEMIYNDCVSVNTSRSCIGNCAFCTGGQSGSFRFVPADQVIDIIRYFNSSRIFKKYIDRIYFNDNSLNFTKDRINELLDGFIDISNHYRMKGYFNLNNLDYNIIQKLKMSHFYQIIVGWDGCTTHQNQIMDLKKNVGMDYNDTKKLIESLIKHDILVTVAFIVGFPGETEDDFEEEKRVVTDLFESYKSSKLLYLTPYEFELQGGSPIFKDPSKFGVEFSYWEEMDCYNNSWNELITTIPKNYKCDLSVDSFKRRNEFFLKYIPDWCYQ